MTLALHLFDDLALVVYVLCALTSLTCSVMLLRGYAASKMRLLLWSGLCFTGFFLNNVLLIVDVRLVPAVDLSVWRSLPSVLGLACLLYGMIWETER
jgi:hypothetical protein